MDLLKGMNRSATDTGRLFEQYVDASRCLAADMIDFCKRRSELEAEYCRSLKKLTDKLHDKNEQFLTMLKYGEDDSNSDSTLYLVCQILLNESRVSLRNSRTYVETSCPAIIIALDNYSELFTFKSTAAKEMFNTVGDKICDAVMKNSAQREKYNEAFLREQKSQKQYDLKVKKVKKQPEEKIRKAFNDYSDDVTSTDRNRNIYITDAKVIERAVTWFYNKLCMDVIRVLNYQSSKFTYYFKHLLITCTDNLITGYQTFRQSCVDMKFSEDSDDRRLFKRCHFKNSLDVLSTNLVVLHARDSINTLMFTGPILAETRDRIDKLKAKLADDTSQIHSFKSEVEAAKNVKIDWNNQYSLDKSKQKMKSGLTDVIGEYLIKYKDLLVKQFQLECTQCEHGFLEAELEFAGSRDRTPTFIIDSKKMYAFGVDLNEYCEEFGVDIPYPLVELKKFLIDHAHIRSQGIFRLCPTKSSLDAFKQSYSNNFTIDENLDSSIVSSCFKDYIRSLRGVSINVSIFEDENFRAMSDDEFINFTRKQLPLIPIWSRNLLIFLADFLLTVSSYSEENKMDLYNLCVCFAPALFASCNISSAGQNDSYLSFLNRFCQNLHAICEKNEILQKFISNMDQNIADDDSITLENLPKPIMDICD